MSKNNTTEEKAVLQDYLISYKTLATLKNAPLEDRIRFIESGINKIQLTKIKQLLHFDYDLLSRVLHITNRCMHMKKENDLFSINVSDRIMAVLELYSFGYEIMGGYADFHEWMLQENEVCMGKKPLDVINTHSGLLTVRTALTHIQFGHL